MPSNDPSAAPVIDCSLSPAALDRRLESLSRVVSEALSVRELDDGLALDFSAGDETEARLFALIVSERRCCPFFRFELVFEPHHGPVRLCLRGPAEAKRLVRLLLAERDASRAASESGATG